MRRFSYLLLLILLLVACSERRAYVDALGRAKAAVNDHPSDALAVLDSLGTHESDFGKHFLMQYRLLRLNTLNKLDTVFRSTTEAQTLADYFDDHGTSNEQMLAHYLLGRAYYDLHEAPMALHCFQEAAEKADTNASDCDYRQLSRVYGQIGNLFYYQNLMDEDRKNTELAIRYAWKGNDTLNALLNMAEMISIYRNQHKKDSAIMICEKLSEQFRQYGYADYSAGILASVTKDLLEKGQIDKAKEYIDRYELESGYFDSNNNIEKGREVYYYFKGSYYLAINRYDSAEYYFRKELREGKDFNNQNGGAHGLAILFQKNHQLDSAVKYSLYSYTMNDSVYARMATNEIERARGLYDYTRIQEMAQKEEKRANAEHNKVLSACFVLFIVITGTIIVVRHERRKRKEETQKYKQSISSLAKTQADIIKLRSQGKELRRMISEKEYEMERLSKDIEVYKDKVGFQLKSADYLLQESSVYDKLKKSAARGMVVSDEEWHQIYMMVIEILPHLYQFIASKKLELNDKEFKICILIRLHFTPKEIANMLDVSSAYITKLRNNMMVKLFGEEGKSKELDERLMQYS